MHPVCTLLCPFHSQSHFFFFLLCQNGEKRHKGHGHGFPLVWLYEKVRGGHHEMAVRPSRRSHWAGSCSTSPEMARAENIPGMCSPEPGRLPWACRDIISSLIVSKSVCLKAWRVIATVWAESPRFRETLLPVPLLHPQISHKSGGLLRSCSFWWMCGSPAYRKHLQHQTWWKCLSWGTWAEAITEKHKSLQCFVFSVFTHQPVLFDISTSLLSGKKIRDKIKTIYKICFY